MGIYTPKCMEDIYTWLMWAWQNEGDMHQHICEYVVTREDLFVCKTIPMHWLLTTATQSSCYKVKYSPYALALFPGPVPMLFDVAHRKTGGLQHGKARNGPGNEAIICFSYVRLVLVSWELVIALGTVHSRKFCTVVCSIRLHHSAPSDIIMCA